MGRNPNQWSSPWVFPEGFLQWISPHLAHVITHLRLSSKLPSRVDHIPNVQDQSSQGKDSQFASDMNNDP